MFTYFAQLTHPEHGKITATVVSDGQASALQYFGDEVERFTGGEGMGQIISLECFAVVPADSRRRTANMVLVLDASEWSGGIMSPHPGDEGYNDPELEEPAAPATPVAPVAPVAPFVLLDAVREQLADGDAWTAPELALVLRDVYPARIISGESVSKALCALVRQGEAKRVAKGQYAMKRCRRDGAR